MQSGTVREQCKTQEMVTDGIFFFTTCKYSQEEKLKQSTAGKTVVTVFGQW